MLRQVLGHFAEALRVQVLHLLQRPDGTPNRRSQGVTLLSDSAYLKHIKGKKNTLFWTPMFLCNSNIWPLARLAIRCSCSVAAAHPKVHFVGSIEDAHQL